MKKNYLLSAVLTVLSAFPTVASAQYISEAPAGGFDFSKGSDYVVIYAPDAQVSAMGSNILSNQNLDPTMTNNQFQYWVADWDKTLFTLYNIEDTQKNSWGGDDKLNMTPLFEWGSGQFMPLAKAYDLSAITDDHILSIGFMNIGDAAATKNFRFTFGAGAANGFMIEVNKAVGAAAGDYVGVGMADKVNTWYYLDIPIKDLIDPDGDFGFEYNFKSPFTSAIFVCGFEGATTSTYAAGAIDPDTGMKTINISKKGSAMAIDHVFLYKKVVSGIESVKTGEKGAVVTAYDLSGRKVGTAHKGLTIVKTADGVRKVIVK